MRLSVVLGSGVSEARFECITLSYRFSGPIVRWRRSVSAHLFLAVQEGNSWKVTSGPEVSRRRP
jgi:hypothetical protein